MRSEKPGGGEKRKCFVILFLIGSGREKRKEKMRDSEEKKKCMDGGNLHEEGNLSSEGITFASNSPSFLSPSI